MVAERIISQKQPPGLVSSLMREQGAQEAGKVNGAGTIVEMRGLATRNSEEIRDAVEDGKRRLAKLAADGNALVVQA